MSNDPRMKVSLSILAAILMISGLFHYLFGSDTREDGVMIEYDAPKVVGVNQAGEHIDFADLYEKGPTVVFFYPKASTPGCTKQACSLRDAFADLSKQGVQVVGVSFDSQENQKKFKDAQKLPFDLISDPEGKIVDAFKVDRMLKGLLSIASRQCFLIKGGKVIWRDAKASTDQQAADIQRVLAEQK